MDALANGTPSMQRLFHIQVDVLPNSTLFPQTTTLPPQNSLSKSHTLPFHLRHLHTSTAPILMAHTSTQQIQNPKPSIPYTFPIPITMRIITNDTPSLQSKLAMFPHRYLENNVSKRERAM